MVSDAATTDGRVVGRPPRVVVVGAGIAGLAAASAVRRTSPATEVVVLEAAAEVGGKLELAEVGGVRVDVGAESMLNRRPEGVVLTRAAGLGDRLVHPATTRAALWSRGTMRALPRTVMGVPADLPALAASGVLSARGAARASQEPDLPGTEVDAAVDGGDISVGWLVEQRFGAEVVDRLVEPMLGGVYAGRARELSLRAAVPQVAALLEREPSLSRAAASVSAASSDVPVFAGLVGGLGQIPIALARGLDVRTGSTVRELRRTPEGGWHLVVGSTRDEQVVPADGVVLAVPAAATARLLRDVAPVAAERLARIDYASMAILTFAFRAGELPVTSGSGFLVPPVDGRAVKAATFSHAKWDWVREAGVGTGDGLLLLRCSMGRHGEERTLQRTDAELVELALADLTDAVGSLRPVDAHVRRWGGALPQYAVGHLDLVRDVRTAVAGLPALAVCGAAYDGVGIPACIASADRAVAQVLAGLPAQERMDP